MEHLEESKHEEHNLHRKTESHLFANWVLVNPDLEQYLENEDLAEVDNVPGLLEVFPAILINLDNLDAKQQNLRQETDFVDLHDQSWIVWDQSNNIRTDEENCVQHENTLHHLPGHSFELIINDSLNHWVPKEF